MAETAASLLTKASIILQDDDNLRWTLAELVGWLNDGLKAVIIVQPQSHAESVALALAEGTLQSLTDPKHIRLLRIIRNLSSAAPRAGGRAIRITDRSLLDTQAPYWHDPSDTPYRKEVRQYVFDETCPQEFYVYPGNDGTGLVEAIVSTVPTLVEPTGDPESIASYEVAIDLREPWGPILIDYVLYRAYLKDAPEGGAGKAAIHYQQFATALGVKDQSNKASNPQSRSAS